MAKAQNKISKEAEKVVKPVVAEKPSKVIESSQQKSDYQNHPKFDKFKSNQGAE